MHRRRGSGKAEGFGARGRLSPSLLFYDTYARYDIGMLDDTTEDLDVRYLEMVILCKFISKFIFYFIEKNYFIET